MVSPRARAIIQQALSAPWKLGRLVAAALWLRALPGPADRAPQPGFYPAPGPGDEHRPDGAGWRLIKSYKLSFFSSLSSSPPSSSSLLARSLSSTAPIRADWELIEPQWLQHIDTVLIGI